MPDQFEIIFYGTKRSGDEKLAVIERVRTLLRLDDQQVARLFASHHGVILSSTSDEAKAQGIVRALVMAGASANYRNTNSTGQWQQWELEETKETVPKQVFKCLACEHSCDVDEGREAPDICPECGVVQSKYDAVEASKRERERIRNSLLAARDARQNQQERELERLRQADLRKEIEKELRKEFAEHGRKARIQSISAAAATFILGIAGAVGYNMWANPPADVAAAAAQTARVTPASNADRALTIANQLVGQFDTNAPPGLAKTLPATIADAADGLPGQLPPVPQSSPDPSAPALESTAQWYRGMEQDPLAQARIDTVAEAHLASGQLDAAQQAASLFHSSPHKVDLQTRIANAGAAAGEPQRGRLQPYQILAQIEQLPQLHDKVAGMLSLEKLQGTPAASTAPDTALRALFQSDSSGTLDRLKAEALIASTRFRQGDSTAAWEWFAAANETLLTMRNPIDQLAALPVLAVRYFEANDIDTARELLGWSRRGLMSLPASPRRADIVESSALAYATIGMIDEAAMTTRYFFTSHLERDLRLARLARDAALQGKILPAEGLLSLINSDAQRATTRAQISLLARYQGEEALADAMAEDARRDSVELAQPAAQVVASELMRATGRGDRENFDRLKQNASRMMPEQVGEAFERAKAVIARNLAWVGETTAASRMADSIRDPQQRLSTQQKLRDIKALIDLEKATAQGPGLASRQLR